MDGDHGAVAAVSKGTCTYGVVTGVAPIKAQQRTDAMSSSASVNVIPCTAHPI